MLPEVHVYIMYQWGIVIICLDKWEMMHQDKGLGSEGGMWIV